VALSESRIWGLISWSLLIVGAVIGLLLRPGDDYVKHWARASIAFTILIILGYVAVEILSLILIVTIIPAVLRILYSLIVILVWIVGIVKSLNGEYWNPPLIRDVAARLGI